MSDLTELQSRAVEIQEMYRQLNEQQGHDAWVSKDYVLGLITDVGELSELIMAKSNLRQIDDVDAKLAHELSDCLFSILVIAQQHDIDLSDAFSKTMKTVETKIAQEMT